MHSMVNGNYRARSAGLARAIAAAPAPVEPMTSYEFSQALRVIRWTPGEAAERLGFAPSTIRKMISEYGRIPEDVAAWLRPYAAETAALNARHPPPQRIGQTVPAKERGQ
ncbi:hypothetical protein BKE38_12565 [Pseudoroseomonas deserti]|uniref:Uncharacterized protein n=1 Tax=Teichococcus deserti TaxID=1817963 RepID=A0A1V2H2R5_9PROT|nr:DNA-binding protein [Pseudoroseomonas deserti]ONG53288.1 hypothetical protein BKE38_12565 [Pseudoroseomonas deserti]